MLYRDPATGKTRIWVADAKSNARITHFTASSKDFEPVKLAVVADVTGDGIEEYAVLGREPNTLEVRTEVRDGATGAPVQVLYFGTSFEPLDMVAMADLNGNGTEELVILQRRYSDGLLRTVIRDAQTGELLNRVGF